MILGHCYSPKQVEETKRKQKILMNEAIKKILPGLNLEEDCSSYIIPNRFVPNRLNNDEEVEYHPLQFGLSSEQRESTTTTPRSTTTPTFISSSTLDNGYSSASKIPTAFLQESTSSPDNSDSIQTVRTLSTDAETSKFTKVSTTTTTVSTITTSIKTTTSTSQPKEVDSTTDIELNQVHLSSTTDLPKTTPKKINMTEAVDVNEDHLSSKRAILSTTPLPRAMITTQTDLNSTTRSEPLKMVEQPEFETSIEDLESISENEKLDSSTTKHTTDVLIFESDLKEQLSDESETNDDLSNVPEDKEHTTNFGNLTLPGELLFVNTNEILTPNNEQILPVKNDSSTDIGKEIFESSTDSNITKLTTQINVIPDVSTNENSIPENDEEIFLPAPIIAKTTMKVNNTTSTTTVKSINIITSDSTLVTAAHPNIAQPISSRKQTNYKENKAPGAICANLITVAFTITIVRISMWSIS